MTGRSRRARPPLLPSRRSSSSAGSPASVPTTTRRILDADNAPSRLDLLTNPRRTTRDALRSALASEGVETELSPLAPLALTVLTGNPLRSPLLAAGHFSVQDVGAQLLPLLLPRGRPARRSRRGARRQVALRRRARPRALDGRGRPLPPAPRARRRERRVASGSRKCAPVAGDFARAAPAGRPLRPRPARRALQRDRNAAQEPGDPLPRHGRRRSSGSRGAQDGRALAAAAALLAPGGFLLYSTCSLEEEENERVVERVLAGEPDLEPAPIDASPGARRPSWTARGSGSSRTTRCDGFTAHLLRRRPASTPDGRAP